MVDVIGTYTIITTIINLLWWTACMEVSLIYGLCFCNPKWIYNHTKTNWFGTICLTVLANIAFGPTALCYWTYKFVYFICTVGRRKYEN